MQPQASQTGHRSCSVGIYNTIITRACVDGVYGTYRSRTQQEAEDKALRLVLNEATKELVGSATYRTQLMGLGTATTPSDDGDVFSECQGSDGMQGTDGWAFAGSESHEDTKMPAVGTEPRSNKRRSTAGMPDQEDMMALASKVNGIELALMKMASAVAQLAEGKAVNRRGSWPDQSLSEGSSEDEVLLSPRGGGRVPVQGPKAKSKTPEPSRRYYAVARGRNPGVYNDWGDAECQVNGFSGALHKKFKSRREARAFVIRHGTKHAALSEDEDDEEEYLTQMNGIGNVAAGHRPTEGKGGESRRGMETWNEVGFPPWTSQRQTPPQAMPKNSSRWRWAVKRKWRRSSAPQVWTNGRCKSWQTPHWMQSNSQVCPQLKT